MSNAGPASTTGGGDIAAALATLFHNMGFAAVIRHAESAAVLACTPGGERAVQLAEPGSTRVAAGRIAGASVRVELVSAPVYTPVRLTPRQLEVAQLLADGLRNGDIAEKLGISAHTVRRHMEAILRRLNVTNRAAAAKELRNGRADGVGLLP
jgi:DNA-binding CsgD family transcriptional regulator